MSRRGAAGRLVTVCVPAYNAAAFIGQTLSSLAAQTYSDLRVLVALEPTGAEETIAVMGDFLADGRFDYYVNKTNHGYALNVRGLAHRVRTPYYAILPHDDMWHPRYLELLMKRLLERPDASAAYGDMFRFGRHSGARLYSILDGPLFDRLFSWFLDGAEGMPWHGVGRSSVLDKPFPENEWDGFAVECEWSLHMLLRGAVIHQPDAIYLKREAGDDSLTAVSVGWRMRSTEDYMRKALEHHRTVMLAPLATAEVSPAQARLLELAAEAAILRRWIVFSSNLKFNFSYREERRAAEVMGALEADGSAPARQILGRLHLGLSRYSMRRGKTAAGVQHAELAAELSPEYGETHLQLAQVYLLAGRTTDALAPLRRAAELMPLWAGIGHLQNDAGKQLLTLWTNARDRAETPA